MKCVAVPSLSSSLCVALVLSLSYALLPHANAVLVNRTIDDSDDSFSYAPFAVWQTNASCADCLHPNFQNAYNHTLHYAFLGSPIQQPQPAPPPPPPPPASASAPAPAPASTASPASASGPIPAPILAAPASTPSPSSSSAPPASSSSFTPTTSSTSSAASTTGQTTDVSGHDGGKGGKDSGDGGGGGGGGSTSARSLASRQSPTTVTATLNFTGSGFYVFCAIPGQPITNASIVSLTDLTFYIDNAPVGNYTHDPNKDTGSTPAFQYQVPVFSKVDLLHGPHELVIQLAQGSTVLLDSVQYTTLDTGDTPNNNGTTAPSATPSGSINSQTNTNSSNKKNTATFGAAIGSSVGLLGVISLVVFISIWRRRRRSAQREKQLEALAQPSSSRPSSPEMRGPQPFIPRYFPGVTVLPRASPSPPPFVPLHGESGGGSGEEESGPSHGLDFPPAPEHVDAPAYSPPPLVLPREPQQQMMMLTTTRTQVPVSLLPPVTRIQSRRHEDPELPRYQDVNRTRLVSIPIPTTTTLPPPAAEGAGEDLAPSHPPAVVETTPFLAENAEDQEAGEVEAEAEADEGDTEGEESDCGEMETPDTSTPSASLSLFPDRPDDGALRDGNGGVITRISSLLHHQHHHHPVVRPTS